MTLPAVTPLFDSEPGFRPLSFTGEGSEYFRIWIVNLALSVVTLGLYSPWAKVRRLQYFHRHTRLAGSGFDFHGDPVAILRGRIIGLALFGSYTLAGLVSPLLTLAAVVAIAAILPWLLARSLRFRCHNSSYRGVRFRFHGSIADAYRVFLGLPLLTLPTLGLLAPFTHQRIRQYQHANAAFGRTRFTFNAPISDFYILYLGSAGILLVVMGCVATAFAISAATRVLSDAGDFRTPGLSLAALAPIAVMYLLGFVAFNAFVRSRVQNLVWGHTQLGGHRFWCGLSARALFGIMLTNLLATIATLGLFRPYAMVRQARYVVGAFHVVGDGTLEDFAADEAAEVSATGEETAEFFGFDIGL